MKKMHFQKHATPQFFKKFKQIHLNAHQACSSNVFETFLNSASSKTFRSCGPTRFFFNLAWPSLGNFLQRNSRLFEQCLAIAFTKFFSNSSLICNGGIKTLSGITKRMC